MRYGSAKLLISPKKKAADGETEEQETERDIFTFTFHQGLIKTEIRPVC
jgi:hypothetical protein